MKKTVLVIVILFFIIVVTVLLAALLLPSGTLLNSNQKPLATNDSRVSSSSETNATNNINQPVMLKNISLVEISKHNKISDCWMSMEGSVYDITPFFGMHPGGNQIMEKYCGQDATRAYQTQDGHGNHSAYAQSLLKIYLIGLLK